jgi:hypothetical protein
MDAIDRRTHDGSAGGTDGGRKLVWERPLAGAVVAIQWQREWERLKRQARMSLPSRSTVR